ncbi:MAG: hypothetical protein HZB66_02725 [Candidatus Aenigmarchaeota archaeon]|nr:hypothetical protein [Candidatus Aenigmarchaeota archaeon]
MKKGTTLSINLVVYITLFVVFVFILFALIIGPGKFLESIYKAGSFFSSIPYAIVSILT